MLSINGYDFTISQSAIDPNANRYNLFAMKNTSVLALFFAAFMFNAVASATPAQIVIIRHGEKPKSGPDLDARGYQRAHALVGFFEKNPAMLRFGRPVAIYAMAPKTQVDPSDDEGSLRAIETVQPL